jgi:hypothetical protein
VGELCASVCCIEYRSCSLPEAFGKEQHHGLSIVGFCTISLYLRFVLLGFYELAV